MVPRGKPLPDLFLYSAARMGAGALALRGDRGLEEWCQAAIAAGMAVFGYADDEDPAELRGAGATPFAAMEDLPALLARDPGERANGSAAPVAEIRGGSLASMKLTKRLLPVTGACWPSSWLRTSRTTCQAGTSAVAPCGVERRFCSEPPRRPSPATHRPRFVSMSVVGSGEVVLSIERFVARRRGRTVDQDVCVVWRMAGARCVEIWSSFSDQASCDRFWERG